MRLVGKTLDSRHGIRLGLSHFCTPPEWPEWDSVFVDGQIVERSSAVIENVTYEPAITLSMSGRSRKRECRELSCKIELHLEH